MEESEKRGKELQTAYAQKGLLSQSCREKHSMFVLKENLVENVLQEGGEGIACENHTRRQHTNESKQEFEEAACQRICLHGGFDRL